MKILPQGPTIASDAGQSLTNQLLLVVETQQPLPLTGVDLMWFLPALSVNVKKFKQVLSELRRKEIFHSPSEKATATNGES